MLVLLFFMFLLLYGCGETSSLKLMSNPQTWQDYYDLGQQYLAEQKYEEAITAFSSAIEIDPKRAAAYVGRGDVYRILSSNDNDREYIEAAYADYITAIEIEKDEGLLDKVYDTGTTLANVYYSDMQFESSLEVYSTLLSYYSEDVALLTGRADCYTGLKDYDKAIKDCLDAIKISPMDSELYKKTAYIYTLMDKYAEAYDILRVGIETTGDHSLIEYLNELKENAIQESEEITVTGYVFYNLDEANYLAQLEEYEDEYGHCCFTTCGIRFDTPVTVTIGDELVTISEAGYDPDSGIAKDPMDDAGKTLTMRGYFVDNRVDGIVYDLYEEQPDYGPWLYLPNGRYDFVRTDG